MYLFSLAVSCLVFWPRVLRVRYISSQNGEKCSSCILRCTDGSYYSCRGFSLLQTSVPRTANGEHSDGVGLCCLLFNISKTYIKHLILLMFGWLSIIA